jgi:hypothetical protein
VEREVLEGVGVVAMVEAQALKLDPKHKSISIKIEGEFRTSG